MVHKIEEQAYDVPLWQTRTSVSSGSCSCLLFFVFFLCVVPVLILPYPGEKRRKVKQLNSCVDFCAKALAHCVFCFTCVRACVRVCIILFFTTDV